MLDLESLDKLNCGMYIVSSKKDDRFDGWIANSIFQVIPEPIMVAASIDKQSLTHDYIENSGIFAVSLLSQETTLSFIDRFESKPGGNINKFADINYRIGQTGSPIILDNTVAFLEVKVNKAVDVATHTLFIGEIVDCKMIDKTKTAMTRSYYLDLKQNAKNGNCV